MQHACIHIQYNPLTLSIIRILSLTAVPPLLFDKFIALFSSHVQMLFIHVQVHENLERRNTISYKFSG